MLTILTVSSFSAETDQYTTRSQQMADSLNQINQIANEHLITAINSANQSQGCNNIANDKYVLYTHLKKEFANHSKGEFTKKILHLDSLDTHVIPLKESVYGKWSIFNGFLLGRKKAASSPLALSPLIKLNGYRVGIDKLEHMFGMGFIYFKQHHLKNRKLQRVLKGGILREKTALGGNILATGVFSYADLAANFNGMRFWNHMLQLEDDVLGKSYNIGPYIKCIQGEWTVNKEIDFSDYIDESMDESINCSKFASRSGLKKYKAAIKSIDSSYKCPMSNDKVRAMELKYKTRLNKQRSISDWIINTNGIGKVKYFREFKK